MDICDFALDICGISFSPEFEINTAVNRLVQHSIFIIFINHDKQFISPELSKLRSQNSASSSFSSFLPPPKSKSAHEWVCAEVLFSGGWGAVDRRFVNGGRSLEM